jgi:hypothetical protein
MFYHKGATSMSGKVRKPRESKLKVVYPWWWDQRVISVGRWGKRPDLCVPHKMIIYLPERPGMVRESENLILLVDRNRAALELVFPNGIGQHSDDAVWARMPTSRVYWAEGEKVLIGRLAEVTVVAGNPRIEEVYMEKSLDIFPPTEEQLASWVPFALEKGLSLEAME